MKFVLNRLIAIGCLCGSLLPASRAFSQSRAAADMYRVAVDALADARNSDAFTLHDVMDAPLDNGAKEIVDRNAKALVTFDAASGMPFGDWGLNPDDTTYAGKTLNRADELADVVVLRARIRAASGQYAEALDDCYNIANLARRFSVQPSLVRQMMQDKLFDKSLAAAGLMFMDAPKDQVQKFVQRLDELRTPADPIDVALAQKQAYLWFYRKVVGDGDLRMKLDKAMMSVGQIFGVTSGPSDVGDLVADSAVAEQVFADTESAFNQMIAALKSPDSERTGAVQDAVRKLHSSHPLVRGAAQMVNQSYQLNIVEPMKVELIRTAAKICTELPRPIDQTRATQLAGSYQYSRAPGGFELLGTIEGVDQPVIIRIGPRPPRSRPTPAPAR